VVPILVAAPLYFAGSISFGGLMMAAGAFTQVQSSLRWFIDNFSVIADWRATLLRVASFRRALLACDALHDSHGRIVFAEGAPGKLTVEGLEIASPAGCTLFEESKVEVKAAERIVIVGEAGVGKTLLFRALAGLWPWGAGRIAWPNGEAVSYVPRRPYLPPGTLREALAYPLSAERFKEQVFRDALERFGLQRLAPLLSESRRWDHELSEDEQQVLVLARFLIHGPRWVLIDEVLDAIDDDTRTRALDIFSKELKDTAVIHIGRATGSDALFTRVLHLIKDPTSRRLVREKAGDARASPTLQTALSS
jgi:vitamin B12/bleomycin/antimicrobial peptide transport system ATP-binding/permease protein